MKFLNFLELLYAFIMLLPVGFEPTRTEVHQNLSLTP